MLEFSSDLPARYCKKFNEKLNLGELFTIHELINIEVPEITKLDEKYLEDRFFYGLFIDQIFGYETKYSRQEFVESLIDPKFKWLFNTY